MDEINTPVSWTRRLERLIADEGEKALCMNWMHIQAEAMYSKRSTAISIPVIVLSTLAGTASIGSSSLFGDSQFSSVGIGLVSIVVGILNTLGSYFAWAKRAEGHRITAQMFAKLNKFITIELALPRAQRMPPGDFLKFVKQEGDRLAETAPAIPPDIVMRFQHRFKKSTVSKPNIANGLDPIEVYDESQTEGGVPGPHPPLPTLTLDDTDGGFFKNPMHGGVSSSSSETSSLASASAVPSSAVPSSAVVPVRSRPMPSLFSEEALAALKKTTEKPTVTIDPAIFEGIKKLAMNPQAKEMMEKAAAKAGASELVSTATNVLRDERVQKALHDKRVQQVLEMVEQKVGSAVPEELKTIAEELAGEEVRLTIRELAEEAKKKTEHEE